MVAHLMRVLAAFEITAQWFDAEGGVIDLPAADEPIVGSHCVTLVGFDLVRSSFVFLNSWGPQWGSHGVGWLPFAYFDRYLVSAWAAPVNAGLLPASFAKKGVIQVAWGVHDWLGHPGHGGTTVHGREVYDGTHDERMGWTFAVHRDGFLDVEEFFVRPQYRRQGVATELVEMLRALAAELKRPLRLWVPFADWTKPNIPSVERISGELGLKMFHAGTRWAAAMALDPSAPPRARQEEGLQDES